MKSSLNHGLKGRKTELFNANWLFIKGNYAGAHESSFNEDGWSSVNLPHDWTIEESFDPQMVYGGTQAYLPRWTVGWYRKRFTVEANDKEQKYFIQFDGIHHNSEVWLNGHFLGRRPYGYVSFQYDLSPYLNREGENVLAVKVDNTVMPPDRWYSGSGIYRNVWLITTDPLHIAEWGTYITTPVISAEAATVFVRTQVINQYEESAACTIVTEIMDHEGNFVGKVQVDGHLSGGELVEFPQTVEVPSPRFWSPDQPALYYAHTWITYEGNAVDHYITPFGIRKVLLDKNKGLFLNGVNLKLKGVCLHHDLGCLGAAYNDRAMERRLGILKDMGCNAIRLSHNPMAAELLDLCDRMGFLVIAEAFDKWKSLYYGQLFEEWWEKDLESMLVRDRNHPSIFMWSVGNEVENQGQESMLEMLELLVNFCHEKDTTRPVTCALEPHNRPLTLQQGSIKDKVRHTMKMAAKMDILSLNYQEQWYEHYREAMPDMLIVGSETFPFFRGKGNRVKAYEPMNPWFDVVNKDYVIGQFVWVGIDYLGEAEYPSKGWSSGLIDTCGFRKPVSYLQQSLWSDKPVVHMAVFDDTAKQGHHPRWTMHWKSPQMVSSWTLPHFEGTLVRMVVFTNCESVELVLNDEVIGEKSMADFPDKMMIWHLPYMPGTLVARGKNKGNVVCVHEMTTAGGPSQLSLMPDRTVISADGVDLVHVEVNIMDDDGTLVPYAVHDIQFELSGEGTIVGVDNGDLTSDEPYKGNRRKAYGGKCLVIIQSSSHKGSIQLTAVSEGLREATVTIQTH
ncbi:glycoside hydrolase family 2 [Paenibacillus rigui]|uniref:Glycoside hydrolase family 2 n=2 Tax=Paenibacillus rigui TaxID=554312 RepID=A0A229URX4_9BACL|nr:glycoside hydrolase family 2 [Paenibacillus rigui]